LTTVDESLCTLTSHEQQWLVDSHQLSSSSNLVQTLASQLSSTLILVW
jgi:hypothetical protein